MGQIKATSRWEYLGEALVDSGQLMVLDPGYIDEHWRQRKDATELSVHVWGRDEAVAEEFMSAQPQVARIERAAQGFLVHPADGVSCAELEAILQRWTGIAGPGERWVVHVTETDCSYDEMGCAYGSILNGLGVAFPSGFGDGSYAVYAEVTSTSHSGERVARVLIEMDPDGQMER